MPPQTENSSFISALAVDPTLENYTQLLEQEAKQRNLDIQITVLSELVAGMAVFAGTPTASFAQSDIEAVFGLDSSQAERLISFLVVVEILAVKSEIGSHDRYGFKSDQAWQLLNTILDEMSD